MKRVWRVAALLSFIALVSIAQSSDLGCEPSIIALTIKGFTCLGLFALSAWKGGLFE